MRGILPGRRHRISRRHCGRWFISDTRFGPLVHAQLFPGEENSGRLVALLRQKAKEMAKKRAWPDPVRRHARHRLPGHWLPVRAIAVVVTEPTPSGRHDLERVAELCGHFRVPVAIIINKSDLNEKEAQPLRRTAGKTALLSWDGCPMIR